jgi:hypothetical protein
MTSPLLGASNGSGVGAPGTPNTTPPADLPMNGNDRCCVPPSPELLERWNAELDKVRSRKGAAFGDMMRIASSPRSLGFDDGYIIPATEFPLGTARLARLRCPRLAYMSRSAQRTAGLPKFH